MRRLIQTELCILLATAMWLTPVAALKAQLPESSGKPGIDTRFVTPQTMAIAFLQPARIIQSPAGEFLPVEVATAAGLKYAGIDPAKIESLQVVFEPPLGPTIFAAAVAKFSEPVDLEQITSRIPPPLLEQFEVTKAGGRPYYKGTQANMPGMYLPDDKTLVIATEPMLKKLFNKSARPTTQKGLILDRLTATPVDDDLFAMVNVEMIRPLFSIATAQAASQMPPEFRKFLQVPQFVRDVELSANITKSAPTQLLVHANDSEDATKLLGLLKDAKELARVQQNAQIAEMKASSDEVQSAMGSYVERMQNRFDGIEPQVEGDTLTVFRSDNGLHENPAVAVAVVGILVAVLLPAVQAAREAARRNSSLNNIKQLNLSLLNFESANGAYPAHAIYSEDGKPLLSWRVAILPYLEEQDLYDEFHLDEPWDSEHNIKLLPRMPQVFLDPSSGLAETDGKTHYLGNGGRDGIFPPEDVKIGMRKITDGTSNTVAIIQVGDEAAVPWTKPADFEVDKDTPLAGIGVLHPSIFLVGMCDGSCQAVAFDIDPTTWLAMLSRAGGEAFSR